MYLYFIYLFIYCIFLAEVWVMCTTFMFFFNLVFVLFHKSCSFSFISSKLSFFSFLHIASFIISYFLFKSFLSRPLQTFHFVSTFLTPSCFLSLFSSPLFIPLLSDRCVFPFHSPYFSPFFSPSLLSPIFFLWSSSSSSLSSLSLTSTHFSLFLFLFSWTSSPSFLVPPADPRPLPLHMLQALKGQRSCIASRPRKPT